MPKGIPFSFISMSLWHLPLSTLYETLYEKDMCIYVVPKEITASLMAPMLGYLKNWAHCVVPTSLGDKKKCPLKGDH